MISFPFFYQYRRNGQYLTQIIDATSALGEKLTISCFVGDARRPSKTWPHYYSYYPRILCTALND